MRRSGALLVEVLVALAIAAGPLLIALGVIHSSLAGARFNADRATARIALIDVSELLLGATIESLRELSRPGKESWLDTLVQERLSHLPDSARDQYEREIAPFLGRFTFKLEEDLDPHARGLARFTLGVRVGAGAALSVVRLFRPGDRGSPERS